MANYDNHHHITDWLLPPYIRTTNRSYLIIKFSLGLKLKKLRGWWCGRTTRCCMTKLWIRLMYFAVVPIFYVKVLFIAIKWRVRWYFTFLLVTSLSQFRRLGWLQRSKSWDAPVSEESGVSMLVFGGHGLLMCVCGCSQYRCIHHTQITLNNYANTNWRASSRKDTHIYGTVCDADGKGNTSCSPHQKRIVSSTIAHLPFHGDVLRISNSYAPCWKKDKWLLSSSVKLNSPDSDSWTTGL